MKIQNLSSKESLRNKFKDGRGNRLCLKHWFERNLPRRAVSNQKIKFELPHMWFDKNSDHKDDI